MKKRTMKKKVSILALVSVASLAVSVLPARAQEQQKPTIKISGLVNGRYSYDDADGSTHGFDIRRARLAADGALSSKIDYKLQAEYETSVKVIDAFFRWKILPALNVQVGQYKVYYSQETLYGPATWLTIENPAAVAKLNGYSDLSGMKANGRDVGITLYGDFFEKKLLGYRIGVFNGNGINVKDNNNKKDVAAMIWIRPIEHLSFTAGQYLGHYGAKGDEKTRNRTSAGVEWKDDKLTVRSEYLFGKTDHQKSDGFYASAGYFVVKKLQPVVSVDYFKADRDLDERQWNYQVGINYQPLKNLRLQAAYTFIDNKETDDTNQVEAQFVLQF